LQEQEGTQVLVGLVQLEWLVRLVEPRLSQVADLHCKHLVAAAAEHRLELRVLKVAVAAEQQGLEEQAEKEATVEQGERLQYKEAMTEIN